MTEETKNFTLTLGPLDSTFLETIRHWRNDYAIWQYTRQNDFISDVNQEAWFKRQASDPSIRMYSIRLSDGEKATIVGVCGLIGIDYLNARAEFSIYIAPGYQKRGLGRKAMMILMSHGFENHGFNLIYGETFDGNPAAKMFEGLGFKWEGTRRDFYFKNGRRIDAHLYSILREEWLNHGRGADGVSGTRDVLGGSELPRIDVAGRHQRGATVRDDGDRPGDNPGIEADETQAKGPKRRRRLG